MESPWAPTGEPARCRWSGSIRRETVVDPLLRLGTTLSEAGDVEERLKEELHIQEGWMDRFPSELSGGELQRFCLARALHPGVRFLLCDEISAMLDLVTQAQIWQFLLEESKRRSGTSGGEPRRQPAGAGVHPDRGASLPLLAHFLGGSLDFPARVW